MTLGPNPRGKMNKFSTIIRSHEKELTDNLTLLSRNLLLSGKTHEAQYASLIDVYTDTMGDLIFSLEKDPTSLSDALRILEELLNRNLKDDQDTSKMVVTSIINKITRDTLVIVKQMRSAMLNIIESDYELKRAS